MSNKITGIKVKVDNSAMIIALMHKKVELGLEAIGAEAEGYAKKNCPVDTGRLRNSITWATSESQGEANTNKHPKGPVDAEPADYKMLGKPGGKYVYIGTNVKYAPYVEYGDKTHKTGQAHFLRDAAVNHGDHYESIMKAALDS